MIICNDADIEQFSNFDTNVASISALDDAIDLSTAAGKFQINVMGALAEMEVDRLSERVRHGWQHLRDRKVAMNPPFGYIKVNDSHKLDHAAFLCLLETRVEKSKAAIAREIVEAFLEKRTLRLALRQINEHYGIQVYAHNQGNHQKGGRVARDMFRFSPSGLRNWLTNPVLQGHLVYLRRKSSPEIIIYNHHSLERLITDEEAMRIQEILAHNSRIRGFGSTALKYPLSGLVFCAECRGSCYSTYGRKNHKHPERGHNYYFQCKNWRTRSCSQKSGIRMEVAEQAVIEALIECARAIAVEVDTATESIEPLELKELKAQLAGLEQLGYNVEIEKAKRALKNQIQSFEHQLHQKSHLDESKRQMLQIVFQDMEYWLTLEPEQKREIYRALVVKISVRNAKVESVELRV